MRPNCWLFAALLATAPVAGQETSAERPVLQNTGAPMRIGFQCTEQDLNLAGLGCTVADPCPVYLELAAVEPVGLKIFVAGNLHTGATTLFSVLLASDDGGKTWHEPFERIRSAVIDQIRFFDFQTGWIGGHIMHTLPYDPFLLLTTDGGVTWRRRPVVEENHVGVIEEFQFKSRTEGSLWLDRSQSGELESLYERYESMTGGESWMLRESNSRPLLTDELRVRRPGSGWRLQPDAASNSYRIERRDGDAWRLVASFLIPAGECRPPETRLAEPPPVEQEEPAEPAPPAQKRKVQ